MQSHTDKKQLRWFGLSVGGIFAIIGVWPVFLSGDDQRWWAIIVAGFLIIPAVVFPLSLSWAYRGWMTLGHILGWINTRIILGLIFYGLVTPIGAVRRLLGKDPMGKALRSDLSTYRVLRQPRPPSH